MRRNKLKDFRGVTLVEVMIALVLLLFVMMGLLQAALLSIDSNTVNRMRDEAVAIAAERLNDARTIAFDSLVNDTAGPPALILSSCQNPPVSDPNTYPRPFFRQLRNMTVPFGTRRTVIDHDANTKEVRILVRWEHRNECSSYSINTLRRR